MRSASEGLKIMRLFDWLSHYSNLKLGSVDRCKYAGTKLQPGMLCRTGRLGMGRNGTKRPLPVTVIEMGYSDIAVHIIRELESDGAVSRRARIG